MPVLQEKVNSNGRLLRVFQIPIKPLFKLLAPQTFELKQDRRFHSFSKRKTAILSPTFRKI